MAGLLVSIRRSTQSIVVGRVSNAVGPDLAPSVQALERNSDALCEFVLLIDAGDPDPLEVGFDPNVGKETSGVFVEMEKCPGAAVEDAAGLLLDSGHLSKHHEERLQLVQ